MSTTHDKVVSIYLMGGLGNQLFQLMTALAYAQRHHVQLLVPTAVIGGRPDYWNSLFRHLRNHLVLVHDPRTLRYFSHSALYKEPSFQYVPLPEPLMMSITLQGYFQSPKYFQSQFQTLAECCQLKEQRDAIRTRFQEALQGVVCAIHFRIGDYIRYPDHHPILPVGYYETALQTLLAENHGKIMIFCQKEDRMLVESERIPRLLEKNKSATFVWALDYQLTDWEELLLMSCASHIVIANSTFSWWAAYLHRMMSTEAGRIMYPSTWFGTAFSHYSTEDLFPTEWNKIQL